MSGGDKITGRDVHDALLRTPGMRNSARVVGMAMLNHVQDRHGLQSEHEDVAYLPGVISNRETSERVGGMNRASVSKARTALLRLGFVSILDDSTNEQGFTYRMSLPALEGTHDDGEQ